MGLGRVLRPGPRTPPGPPQTPPKTDFSTVFDPNLVDFGPQLNEFWTQLGRFWASTWWIIVKQWRNNSLGNQLTGCPTPGTVAGMARRATEYIKGQRKRKRISTCKSESEQHRKVVFDILQHRNVA